MLDATREGFVKLERAETPSDPGQRASHLKAFGYYRDASQVGLCEPPASAFLDTPITNPDVGRLPERIQTARPKTQAAGIDVIMARLEESLRGPPVDYRHRIARTTCQPPVKHSTSVLCRAQASGAARQRPDNRSCRQPRRSRYAAYPSTLTRSVSHRRRRGSRLSAIQGNRRRTDVGRPGNGIRRIRVPARDQPSPRRQP